MKAFFMMILLLVAQPCQAQRLGRTTDWHNGAGEWHNGPDNWLRSPGNDTGEDANRDLAGKNSIYNDNVQKRPIEKSLMAPAGREGYFRNARDPKPKNMLE